MWFRFWLVFVSCWHDILFSPNAPKRSPPLFFDIFGCYSISFFKKGRTLLCPKYKCHNNNLSAWLYIRDVLGNHDQVRYLCRICKSINFSSFWKASIPSCLIARYFSISYASHCFISRRRTFTKFWRKDTERKVLTSYMRVWVVKRFKPV